jgi:hypothetical protein
LSGRDPDGHNAMALGGALYRSATGMPAEDAKAEREQARLLREAGEAFIASARAQTGRADGHRNLGVVWQALPAAEEKARIAELMEKHQAESPDALANRMLLDQRTLAAEIPAAFTNAAPDQIRRLEALAARQKETADLWIPLKGKLLAAMGQQETADAQQQFAALEQFIETTREAMLSSADNLRDLDPAGYDRSRRAEAAVYHLWKGVAPYAMILEEDLRLQTNLLAATPLTDVQTQEAAERQREAAALTRLFTERFTAAAPEKEAPEIRAPESARTSVESPEQAAPEPLSAADRQKILELAAAAAAAQTEAAARLDARAMAEARQRQVESSELLRQIRELLPKQPSSQSQQQDQQQELKQDQQQEQKQDQQESKQSEQEQPEQPEQEQPEQPEQEQPEKDAQQQKPEETEDQLSEEEVRRLLEKALQREKEHEREKQRRQQSMELSPILRDW